MLEVLNDPAHAALVGWIVSVALATALPVIGLIGWLEFQNRRDHRDLGNRIDQVNRDLGNRIDQVNRDLGNRIDQVIRDIGNRIDQVTSRIDDLHKLIAERLPPKPENP